MQNKDDFIKELSRAEKISLGEASKYTDAVLKGIMKAVKSKGGVKFIGFGNFEKAKTKARVGRNPQTGARINIPENVKPVFKPGKIFKDSVALKNRETTPVETEAKAPKAPRTPAAAGSAK